MNDSNYGKISLVFRWLFIALNAPQVYSSINHHDSSACDDNKDFSQLKFKWLLDLFMNLAALDKESKFGA